MSEIIGGGFGGHGDGSAGWHAVFGYGGHLNVAPRVTRAVNSGPGRVCLFFTEEMKHDPAFTTLTNYVVTPLPGYPPLTLTGVFSVGPDRICFTFTGGPGAYKICAFNVRDEDDELLVDPLHRCATFFVNQPGIVAQTFIRVFDTVLGPVGLRQVTSGVITVEDLLQQRMISQGVTAQLNQIMANLTPVGASRDSSRIPFLRTR
jgi:hypothetical protein